MNAKQSQNPLADLITDIASITIGALFSGAREDAEKKRKERAITLRTLIASGKRFRLEEMVSMLNHSQNLQTIEQIAAEIELPVVVVESAVKRWFFF